jgi:hypothetical protein
MNKKIKDFYYYKFVWFLTSGESIFMRCSGVLK